MLLEEKFYKAPEFFPHCIWIWFFFFVKKREYKYLEQNVFIILNKNSVKLLSQIPTSVRDISIINFFFKFTILAEDRIIKQSKYAISKVMR